MQVQFLFNKDIQDYRDKIRDNFMRIIGIHQRLREIPYSPTVENERTKLITQLDEILQWYFREVLDGFEKKFKPYLNLGDIDP